MNDQSLVGGIWRFLCEVIGRAGAGFTIKTTIVSNSKEETSQGYPYKIVLCLALMHTVIILVIVFWGFI